MNKSSEIIIFCVVVLVIGLTFVGGVMLIRRDTGPVITPTSTASVVLASSTRSASGTTIALVPVTIAPTPSSSATTIFTLPYTLDASSIKYWLQYWGMLTTNNSELILTATTTTTGGSAFLDHASSWTNYTAEANVQWMTGGWFDIAARVTNNTENFVYCEFGANTLGIVRRVNYIDTAIATGYMPSGTTMSAQLGMSVYNDAVGCLVNGKEVLGAEVAQNESPAGGVGFIAWGEKDNNQLIVKNFSVVALKKDTLQIPFAITVPAVAPTDNTTSAATSSTTISTSTIASSPSPVIVPPAPTEASQASVLPYSESKFTGDTNWQGTWGAVGVNAAGNMTIGADGTLTTGGQVILENSNAWTDYTFASTLDWLQGETIGIIARRVDSNDYVDCNYFENSPGDIQVELQQYSNGIESTLAEGTFSDLAWTNQQDANIIMTVSGPTGTCSFNGFEITNSAITNDVYSIGSALFSGGIGFTTWDPTPGNSEIVVKQVSVTPGY